MIRTFKVGDPISFDETGSKGFVTRLFEHNGEPYFDVTWDDGKVMDYKDEPGNWKSFFAIEHRRVANRP